MENKEFTGNGTVTTSAPPWKGVCNNSQITLKNVFRLRKRIRFAMPGRSISEIQQLNREEYNDHSDDITEARVDAMENGCHDDDDDTECLVETT